MSDGVEVFRVEDAAPIERWLRKVGVALVALHHTTGDAPGWLVNGQTTLDEAGLLQMANIRRRRAGLPPFVWGMPAIAPPVDAAAARCAPAPTHDQPLRPRRRRRAAMVQPPAAIETSPELLRVKLLAADLALQLDAARRHGDD
jgi:hypothetical protein